MSDILLLQLVQKIKSINENLTELKTQLESISSENFILDDDLRINELLSIVELEITELSIFFIRVNTLKDRFIGLRDCYKNMLPMVEFLNQTFKDITESITEKENE